MPESYFFDDVNPMVISVQTYATMPTFYSQKIVLFHKEIQYPLAVTSHPLSPLAPGNH